MAITVKLPTQLRATVGGASTVSASGATVGQVLDDVFGAHPELRDRIADEGGELRRFVNVYVGGEDIRYLDGLETAVADGSEVQILPAVAGG
ncbi:MAG TPA: ubiquitin-like small modifier protein 1 [Solirubrobacteraceae bacterium]|jgi:molybdopterin converting factor small subunit|nr:ubiquitin-like small modifier protein 1 [Solirubrobacteraceae bacterium]